VSQLYDSVFGGRYLSLWGRAQNPYLIIEKIFSLDNLHLIHKFGTTSSEVLRN